MRMPVTARGTVSSTTNRRVGANIEEEGRDQDCQRRGCHRLRHPAEERPPAGRRLPPIEPIAPEGDQGGEVEHEEELPVVADRKQRLLEMLGEEPAGPEGDGRRATFTPLNRSLQSRNHGGGAIAFEDVEEEAPLLVEAKTLARCMRRLGENSLPGPTPADGGGPSPTPGRRALPPAMVHASTPIDVLKVRETTARPSAPRPRPRAAGRGDRPRSPSPRPAGRRGPSRASGARGAPSAGEQPAEERAPEEHRRRGVEPPAGVLEEPSGFRSFAPASPAAGRSAIALELSIAPRRPRCPGSTPTPARRGWRPSPWLTARA